MFNILRRRPTQISSQPILDTAIDRLVAERNAHLAEMNRLENVINDAQRTYNQHTRLYEALNNTLFSINHPFDAKALEVGLCDAIDADLSVDQPSDEERQEAATMHPMVAANMAAAERGEFGDSAPLECLPIPFRSRGNKRGNTRPITDAGAAG